MTASPDRLVVLLADDNEDDVVLIRRSLENLGRLKKLIAVPDGEQAIDYLLGSETDSKKGPYPFPDVLILDHRMPRLSGLGVLCWLRDEARFLTLPVLVFSEAMLPAEIEAVERLGATCCLKPTGGRETGPVVERGIENAFQIVKTATVRSQGGDLIAPRVFPGAGNDLRNMPARPPHGTQPII